MRVVVGICGASGVIYGVRLIEVLKNLGHEVYVVVTRNGLKVLELECGRNIINRLKELSSGFYGDDDWGSPLVSSSWIFDCMVIAPCSMKTLAAISHGYSHNVLVRAAINALRLGKKLVLVLRETPLSVFDLENALRVARAGAVVLPASPAFYHEPKSISDMVDFVVGKVLDVLGIEHKLYKRWREHA